MLSYIAKHSKQRKSTKRVKLQWIASIWCQNDLKCWVTSQNMQNNAKLRNWSNYNELHRFDVKTIKNVELRRTTFKTTQNNEIDQIIMHCNDLKSKRCKKLSYVPKLQKWSNYNELHRFDVKTIKNVELRRTTFKTTQNYEIDQIIMHCNDLKSKRSKKLSYVPNLRKWSNYNELDRFDVKTIKTLS